MSIYSRDSLEASARAKAPLSNAEDLQSIHSSHSTISNTALKITDLDFPDPTTPIHQPTITSVSTAEQVTQETQRLPHLPSAESFFDFSQVSSFNLQPNGPINTNTEISNSAPTISGDSSVKSASTYSTQRGAPSQQLKPSFANSPVKPFASIEPKAKLSQNNMPSISFSLDGSLHDTVAWNKSPSSPTPRPLSPSQKLIASANSSLHASNSHRSIDMNTIAQFANFQSKEKLDYQKELMKLLQKSKGTAYEQSLKRFVEKKLKEIERDQEEAKNNLLFELSTLRNGEYNGSPPGNKLSLMSLTTSKYDTPRGTSPNQFSSSGINPFSPSKGGMGTGASNSQVNFDFFASSSSYYNQLSEEDQKRESSRQRIENMSQPLDRNKYKGPEDPLKRVTTNHLGRQRPPPKHVPIKDSPHHIHKQMFSPSRAHHHSKKYQEAHGYSSSEDGSYVVDEHHQQSGKKVRYHSRSPKRSTSMSEFKQWLKKNQEWERKHKQNVVRTKESIDHQLVNNAQPRIFSKSIKLTEIAQMKESQQLRQMNQIIIEQQLTEETLNNIHPMNNSQSSSHYRHPSSERKKETRLMTPAEILHHHATTSNANGILDVYDRMAIRGRIFTEKKRNFTPPVRQESFSPAILERSVKLAERRKSRLMTSASMDNGSIDGGAGGGQGLKRSNSASSLIIDYNALPYRKESPEIQRERKRIVNSRRHYLEQKQTLISSSPARSSSPYPIPLSPAPSRGSSPHPVNTHNHQQRPQQQYLEQENVVPSKNHLLGHPATVTTTSASISSHPTTSLPVHPPQRSASPALSHHPHNQSNLSVGGGQSVSQRSVSSHSARTVNLTDAVKYDIERSRSRSKTRKEKELQEKLQKTFGRKKVDTMKPFQPVIIAPETKKIMSKVKSSFEERNIKSIENLLIRKVISSRTPSPGPGHYSGLSVASHLSNSLSAPSPQRVRTSSATTVVASTGAEAADVKLASPGRKGFTFSKEKLMSSCGPYDPKGNPILSVYEFKPPQSSPSHRSSGLYPTSVHGADGNSVVSSPQIQRVNSIKSNY